MPRKFLYPVLERAGLKRVWFHDLRHTAISHMLGNGEIGRADAGCFLA